MKLFSFPPKEWGSTEKILFSREEGHKIIFIRTTPGERDYNSHRYKRDKIIRCGVFDCKDGKWLDWKYSETDLNKMFTAIRKNAVNRSEKKRMFKQQDSFNKDKPVLAGWLG